MIEYTIDREQWRILIAMGGADNEVEHVTESWGRMYRDPDYDSSFDHLCVIADDASGPLLGQVPTMKSTLEVVAQNQPVPEKWAVVVPSLLKRTLAEFMFKDAQLGLVQMRFFATEADALKWLEVKS